MFGRLTPGVRMLLLKNALGGVAAISVGRGVEQRAHVRQRLGARPTYVGAVDAERVDRELLVRLQRLAERFGLERVRERAKPAARARVDLLARARRSRRAGRRPCARCDRPS